MTIYLLFVENKNLSKNQNSNRCIGREDLVIWGTKLLNTNKFKYLERIMLKNKRRCRKRRTLYYVIWNKNLRKESKIEYLQALWKAFPYMEMKNSR